jgi:hypothetical protein
MDSGFAGKLPDHKKNMQRTNFLLFVGTVLIGTFLGATLAEVFFQPIYLYQGIRFFMSICFSIHSPGITQ